VSDSDQLHTGLGEALRELREQRGVSQERLSLETGIHRNYIGGIERAERRPSLAVVAELALALDVRPSQLITSAERRAENAGASWPAHEAG
jgi:transcriptional regulator with XRE-family HTH domain